VTAESHHSISLSTTTRSVVASVTYSQKYCYCYFHHIYGTHVAVENHHAYFLRFITSAKSATPLINE
jgi:hypothetical protein